MTVLFLCTGNSCRSQMAEGFAKTYGQEEHKFVSSGTHPSREVHPVAVQVMAERGIDISKQYPKLLADVPKPIDSIIAVCGQAAEECPVPPPGVGFQAWDLPDPVKATGSEEEILAVFRSARDDIERRVLTYLRSAGALSESAAND